MRLLLTILSLLWALPASAQVHSERYEYEVHWGYSDVARVKLQRACPREGYVPARLAANSLGVINQVHEFQIELDSFVDLAGRTLEGRTFIKEEGVPRRYRTRFAKNGSAYTRKTYKKKDSTLRLELRPGTFDLLSWFFALRDQELVEGKAYAFYVWDGWKLARVTARVGGSEDVWTPAGTFAARRLSLTRTRLHHGREHAYRAKAGAEKIGTMWLSLDARNTPVAMDFKAPVGMAKLRLVRQKTKVCKP